MATITEDYVSFETAELLKEKGMDVSCFNHYTQKNNNDGTSEAVTVCTLQMAMKWLREVYNWNVVIRKSHMIYGYDIYIESLVASNVIEDAFEKTYEQACEAAIKYCLENLI